MPIRLRISEVGDDLCFILRRFVEIMVHSSAFVFPRNDCFGECDIAVVHFCRASLIADMTGILFEYFRITAHGFRMELREGKESDKEDDIFL